MDFETIPYTRMKDATVGSTRIKKEIIESREFSAAKNGNESAASDIIRQIWSNKKTEILKNELGGKDTVFISQPSTTGSNIIPGKFAEHLANLTESKAINGDDYYFPSHTTSSKNIPRDKRVFNPREYEGVALDAFRKEVGNRQLFVVEDILNTGGSVRAFSERLKVDGFDVRGVVALMGERRLSLDQKTTDLLNKAMEEKGIKFKADGLQITRLEAGGLIRMTNNVRSEHAKNDLTRNLQGLQDRQVVADIGRDPQQAGRNIGDAGGNINHAYADKGIQTDASSSTTNHQQAINGKDRYFVVVDDSFRILNNDGNFRTQDGKTATFIKPEEALEVAFKKRAEHVQELEGSTVYVHRVENGEVIFKPYLKTVDSPHALNALWSRQMGNHNPVPENLIQYAKPISLQPHDMQLPEKSYKISLFADADKTLATATVSLADGLNKDQIEKALKKEIKTLSTATPGVDMDKTKVKVEIVKDSQEKAKVDIQGINKMRGRDDFSI
ncbi:hypothetical protein HGB07_02155 [Candidatus Roizmanbacteria bacterium]|nr:hypothetical protein [Candidatus Roizmanbacteria bacterium]